MEVALFADAKVYLLYHNSGMNTTPYIDNSVQGSAKDLWPELNTFMASCQTAAGSSGDVVTTKLYRKVDANVIQIPPLTSTYQLATQRSSTVKYSQRLQDGEVFMNPYSTGRVTVTRSVGIVVPTDAAIARGVIASQQGWFSSSEFQSFMNARGLFPPVPPASRNGSPLRGWSVLLTWRWVVLPDSALYVSPNYIPPNSVPALVIDSAMVTGVVADASDGELDLLTETMELPETLGFLGESVKSALCLTADLAEEARSMRKRMPVAKFITWFANHWLKGRYALLPIFYTILGIQEVLKSIGREYGKYSQKADVHCLLGDITVPGCIVQVEHKATARCVMKVRYTITSLLDSLQRSLNINLFTSLWETKALSFVADWAFNIGDFIQASTGSIGASQMCTSFAVKDTSTIRITYDNDTMPATTNIALDMYRREIINPYDHIGLKFVLGRELNWTRSIDAFVLAVRPGIRRFEAAFKKQGAI